LFANNVNIDGHRQYTRLAYACAMTIRLTQQINNVSVVTNDISAFKDYRPVFDHIIEYAGPGGMDARSRAYDYSPYDETVLLDADMLFVQSMDHYWDLMGQQDLFITTAAQTHRAQQFHYGYYRTVMERNGWPDVYSAWTYFRRSDTAYRFFEQVKTITDNPQQYINLFMSETQYKTVPTDEAFALALCLLDLESVACNTWDFPRITHMKPAVQGWRESIADWTDRLQFLMSGPGDIKLGVWQQADVLHYVKKELITDSVIDILESAL